MPGTSINAATSQKDEGFSISTNDLSEAVELLRPIARKTPLLPSQKFPGLFFKTENLQQTGSFKLRTAYRQLSALGPEERRRGIVTASSGNFAQAVAYAAKLLGISAKIVMMPSSSAFKIARTRAHGAEVVFCEDRFSARDELVEELHRSEGRKKVHPFDHRNAILGNATIGLEILEQLPSVQHVVVPVSGGGLIAGIAAAIKKSRPDVRIFGVQAEQADAAAQSFRRRERVAIQQASTIADGLSAGCPGRLTLPLILQHVDDVVTVTEKGLVRGVCHLAVEEKLVVEPSGAASLAAVLESKIPDGVTVLVLSGGNVDPTRLGAWLAEVGS